MVVLSGCVQLNPAVYECPRTIRERVHWRSGAPEHGRSASTPPTPDQRTSCNTATLCPAHSATCVDGTPVASHVDTDAWRKSYGRLASGESYSSTVNAALRAQFHTRPIVDSATPPLSRDRNRPSEAVPNLVRCPLSNATDGGEHGTGRFGILGASDLDYGCVTYVVGLSLQVEVCQGRLCTNHASPADKATATSHRLRSRFEASALSCPAAAHASSPGDGRRPT